MYTMHTIHQCCYVLLCPARLSINLLSALCPALQHSAQHSTAVETASNQRGLSAVCTLAHLTIRPSDAVSF